jgi:hypothetical protein
MNLTPLQDACSPTERFAERLAPAQCGLAAPCTEWDVPTLINHLGRTP